MNTIQIDENVKDLVPNEFLDLPDVDYRLTKVEAFNDRTFVYEGQTVTGSLKIIEVKRTGKPGVRVSGHGFEYIRTSPIVVVTDSTKDTITFRTEGGVYKLERLSG